jgi:hypothetical protein
MQKPSKVYFLATISLFKYLKNTIDLVLCYKTTELTDYYPIVASNSNYTGYLVTARFT